jgi:hypothetical protein
MQVSDHRKMKPPQKEKSMSNIRFKQLRSLTGLILVITALLLMQITLVAQSDQGRITGTVRDQTGAVIPGATIVVKNERTGDERTTTSNGEGFYQVTGLRPSLYTVKISAANFLHVEVVNAQVLVGQAFTLDAELRPTGGTESITIVGGEQAAIDTASATMGANVNPREVQSLPLNGRQVSQLYLQAPGALNSGSGTFGDIRFNGRAVEQNIVRYDGIEGTAIIDASPGNLNGEVPSSACNRAWRTCRSSASNRAVTPQSSERERAGRSASSPNRAGINFTARSSITCVTTNSTRPTSSTTSSVRNLRCG